MDSDFIKSLIYGVESSAYSLIVLAFILGVIFVLSVGGLIWGGIYLYKNYSVVKITNSSTNVCPQSTNVYSVN